MILRLSTADENLLLLRNPLPGSLGPHTSCSHVGTGHRPRPNQLLSGTLQIRTSSPHGPFAARDQATSAEYQFGSGSSQLGRGNAPSPHVSKMRAVPRGPELMDKTRIFIEVSMILPLATANEKAM